MLPSYLFLRVTHIQWSLSHFMRNTCTCTLIEVAILNPGHSYICTYQPMLAWLVICGQKLTVWGLTVWKSSVGVIYCLLVLFNCWNYYTGLFVQRKKFGSILLMGQERVSGKLYYSKPHPLMQLQCRPTISLVCTDKCLLCLQCLQCLQCN